jgi:hypothetical protein
MIGPFLCRVCTERDGIEATSVVEDRCTDERTGKHFTANVCARCLEAGRETRVTCRTFGHIDRRSLFARFVSGATGDPARAVIKDPRLIGLQAELDSHHEAEARDLPFPSSVPNPRRWQASDDEVAPCCRSTDDPARESGDVLNRNGRSLSSRPPRSNPKP